MCWQCQHHLEEWQTKTEEHNTTLRTNLEAQRLRYLNITRKQAWNWTCLEYTHYSTGYLCLTQPQLYPLQGLTEDAAFFLFHTAVLQRLQALLGLLQVLQQTAVFSSQRLQPCNHLLRTAQNFLCWKHRVHLIPAFRIIWPGNTRGH